MFFCDQEGTQSSFQGVRDVIEARGLFCSLYSDRGSHYWHTPEAGGKVDKSHPTQFGRALQQLGIEMIPARNELGMISCASLLAGSQRALGTSFSDASGTSGQGTGTGRDH